MNEKNRGVLFILLSSLTYGTYGVWSRLMSDSFGEFSQAWTRGGILLLLMLFLNYRYRIFKKISKKDLPWFIAIACAGGLNQAPYFYGFKHLNIGTATLLFYAALVSGGYILGKYVFGEKFTFIKLLSLALSILGMVIIYNFTLNADQFFAASLTVIAGLMGSVSAVLPKKLSHDYAEFQIMTGYFIVMVFANGLIAIVLKDQLPSFSHNIPWLAQLAYTGSLLLANWSVIEGYKYIEATIGSLLGTMEILFGILFGILFFGETLTAGILVGGLIIIISAVLPNYIRSN